MHYVYLTNNVVTDQAQVDPYSLFTASYASQFIEAPDEVTFNWVLENDVWTPPPGPTPAQIQQENKSTASALLQQTDWICTVDITNPEYSNPYLTNQSDFLAYRSTVRAIAVNPPTTPAVFPTKPQEVWSS
jgi:hypothetical protein